MTMEYITLPGDRWDLIAYKSYGTVGQIALEDGQMVNAMSYIVQANPGLKLDSILSEGLLLQVPVIPSAAVKTDPQLLPPWKR
ncbi:tail protein X [Chitinophaga sp. CF418]|uniref:tail protein X n=1 Tax=Chitinophaga sp. CF418 TaxID=1855287 RepID=UPI00091702B6|nr:tail protein X [Chitinophaga sp. CF418]SHN45944.1 Phage Tail Protein X [Chitinophaga sp. CF418]